MNRKPNPALILLAAALLLLAAAAPAAYGALSIAAPAPATLDFALEPQDDDGASVSPQQFPPAIMTELADGVYHYFGFFSSSLIVIDGGEVLVTDPSLDLRAQSIREEIAKLTDAPVSVIALTHEHYDHVGGTGVFPDATVICHINCQPVFDLDVLGDVPEVDVTFDRQLDVNVGEKLVELHYLGPGDGEATTIVYMPAEQIILTADLYEPRALSGKNWVDDKNFTGTRHILNTVSQWPLRHAINAHSPGTNPQELHENVAYYNDLFAAVYQALADAANQGGMPALFGVSATLPQTLRLEQYQDWGNYDTAFPRHVERMILSITHAD